MQIGKNHCMDPQIDQFALEFVQTHNSKHKGLLSLAKKFHQMEFFLSFLLTAALERKRIETILRTMKVL